LPSSSDVSAIAELLVLIVVVFALFFSVSSIADAVLLLFIGLVASNNVVGD